VCYADEFNLLLEIKVAYKALLNKYKEIGLEVGTEKMMSSRLVTIIQGKIVINKPFSNMA
jgi:hypothetical protein